MRKVEIKKLRYPFWLNLIFYLMTLVGPVICILILLWKGDGEFIQKTSRIRISTTVIIAILVSWSAIDKWLLTGIKQRLIDKKAKLENDYETGIGNVQKVKAVWFSNEFKLTVMNFLGVIVWGTTILTVIYAISNLQLFKGWLSLIWIPALYAGAFALKFFYIAITMNTEVDDGEEQQNS